MEITLRQIGYFIKLAEKGSFTAAADALGITQPALSIAVSQLEKALGAELIVRGSHPVCLSEHGETFHRYALRVVRDLSEARGELAALSAGMIGRLELCMGPSAATAEIGDVLTSMSADFPSLAIGVQSGVAPAVLERLHAGEFPIYVGSIPDDLVDDRFDIVTLDRMQLVVVAAPHHPLAGRADVSERDLIDAAWIKIGNVDANLPNWAGVFERAGLAAPRAAINVRNIALVRSLLRGGHFVCILPVPMVQADLDAGLLVSIDPVHFDWAMRFAIVTRREVTLPAAARLVRDRLVARYGVAASSEFIAT
jgi:DNA-binding transcriptional LysR family regulator